LKTRPVRLHIQHLQNSLVKKIDKLTNSYIKAKKIQHCWYLDVYWCSRPLYIK